MSGKTVRICCRLPKSVLEKLDKIDDETTRSYKLRKAINEYCYKNIDDVIKKYKK